MDDCKAYVARQAEPCLILLGFKKFAQQRPPMPSAPPPPKVKI